MKSHAIGFENRWTSGEHARAWVCELERLGLPTVRVMFADHETHHADAPKVVFDIPPGFVRDWLAYHDRRIAREQLLWRASVIGLGVVTATAAIVAALR